jgi:hypothetical protein
MNRSISIRTGLRLRHLCELDDLDICSQHFPLGLRAQAAVSCFVSASRSPRSAKPACSSRSMRATSVSVRTPGRSSATNFTRHTCFGTRLTLSP